MLTKSMTANLTGVAAEVGIGEGAKKSLRELHDKSETDKAIIAKKEAAVHLELETQRKVSNVVRLHLLALVYFAETHRHHITSHHITSHHMGCARAVPRVGGLC